MTLRNSIALKLSAAVILIVSVTLVLAAAIDHLLANHHYHELARANLLFDSKATAYGLDDPMMSHSLEGVQTYFQEVAGDSEVYTDLRLVDHRSGVVVAALRSGMGPTLALQDRACAVCHDLADPSSAGSGALEQLFESPRTGDQLAIVTPLLNRPSCQTAACHTQDEPGAILGLLLADYSLGHLDPSLGRRSRTAVLVLALEIALSSLLLALLFQRVLRGPIQSLIAGTRRLAQGERDYRFPAQRTDELGELESAFNRMAERIQEDQSQLYEAMEYLGGIIENSADIIITVSLEHRIQTFNTGAERALGYTRADVQGRRMRLLFARPEDRDEALKILENQDNVRNFSTQFRTKSGEIRDVLLTLSRLRDREGNLIGTFGISKDITEEKKLLRQLIQSKKLIAIGQAVTGIQHATKNMLSALKGGAYLVNSGLKKDDTTRLREGWAMVEDGIASISDLSKSMLNYAREWQPKYETCDLNQLTLGVAESLEQSSSGRGISIRTTPFDGLPSLRCDPQLIRTAIMDIASNALDACDAKEYEPGEAPEVLLKVYPDDDRKKLVIEISDNGCGMDGEVIKRVFEPFFSTKEQWGTGIGLAMTTRVIEAHGGHCEVESEVGRGATFRIVLPISNADLSAIPRDLTETRTDLPAAQAGLSATHIELDKEPSDG